MFDWGDNESRMKVVREALTELIEEALGHVLVPAAPRYWLKSQTSDPMSSTKPILSMSTGSQTVFSASLSLFQRSSGHAAICRISTSASEGNNEWSRSQVNVGKYAYRKSGGSLISKISAAREKKSAGEFQFEFEGLQSFYILLGLPGGIWIAVLADYNLINSLNGKRCSAS